MPPDLLKTYTMSVDPAFGFSKVRLTGSVPNLPLRARTAGFGYHALDQSTGLATDTVVGTYSGGLVLSEDLGQNWTMVPLSDSTLAGELGLSRPQLGNAFVTKDGTILAQVKAPPTNTGRVVENSGAVLRFDKSGTLLGMQTPGQSHWHGSRTIDQSGDTIMYAEYPNNRMKYRLPEGDQIVEADYDLRVPTVYRSRDDGQTWNKVFEVSWTEIRHFHTIAADPFLPKTWWLSSGDKPDECRVWRSDDDGDSWRDVSLNTPEFDCYPRIKDTTKSAYRYTDIWIGEDRMIWGADDWLGGEKAIKDPDVPASNRAGSRMFMTPKSEQLTLSDTGYVGSPVRSIIDVGEALIITTEAKRDAIKEPQIMLMSKKDPNLMVQLGSVPVADGNATGFTFSRASRAAKDGVFFTFRSKFDFVEHPTRMMQWKIDFT